MKSRIFFLGAYYSGTPTFTFIKKVLVGAAAGEQKAVLFISISNRDTLIYTMLNFRYYSSSQIHVRGTSKKLEYVLLILLIIVLQLNAKGFVQELKSSLIYLILSSSFLYFNLLYFIHYTLKDFFKPLIVWFESVSLCVPVGLVGELQG